MVGPDAVAVRRAEVPGDPLPFYGGLELGDAAFEILVIGVLFVGSGAAAVAPAAAAGRLCRFKLEEVFYHLGVLQSGRRGDRRQGALDDVVAVRGGRGEVIEMGIEILREISAGHADFREVRDGPAVRGGDDVLDRLGGGLRPK